VSPSTLPACLSAYTTTPGWFATRKQTDSCAKKDGHAAAGLRPVYASCCPSRPRRLSRSQAFMLTTRIPALLKCTRMKLAAPIVDKCLVRDGEVHHPATSTCAAGSLSCEERSAVALLFSTGCGIPWTLDLHRAPCSAC